MPILLPILGMLSGVGADAGLSWILRKLLMTGGKSATAHIAEGLGARMASSSAAPLINKTLTTATKSMPSWFSKVMPRNAGAIGSGIGAGAGFLGGIMAQTAGFAGADALLSGYGQTDDRYQLEGLADMPPLPPPNRMAEDLDLAQFVQNSEQVDMIRRMLAGQGSQTRGVF